MKQLSNIEQKSPIANMAENNPIPASSNTETGKSQSATSTAEAKPGDGAPITKKDIDTNAKKIWDGYTQKQKVNHYTTYAGKIKPGRSHFVNKVVGKMTFDALPKYARQSLKDDAEDMLKRKS